MGCPGLCSVADVTALGQRVRGLGSAMASPTLCQAPCFITLFRDIMCLLFEWRQRPAVLRGCDLGSSLPAFSALLTYVETGRAGGEGAGTAQRPGCGGAGQRACYEAHSVWWRIELNGKGNKKRK